MKREAKKYLYDIQQVEAQRLNAEIEANLKWLGFSAERGRHEIIPVVEGTWR